MIANLKNYVPETIDVVLDEGAKEMFPNTLFEGGHLDTILDIFGHDFVATFPTNMQVTRKMDDFEIRETREEYCIITEGDLPAKEMALLDAIEDAKRLKKNAEEELDAVRKRIAELAFKVKLGTVDYKLPETGTVQFCLNGYRLTYSWINGGMQLVHGEKLTIKDRNELWSQEDRNREIFNKLFETDYPEIERPEDAKPQNLEEALEDAYNLEESKLPFEN